MIRKLLWIGILAWTCAQSYAQNTTSPARKELKYGAQYYGKRTDSAISHWRSLRFGQFLHWGLYSIPGGEWNGKVYSYAAEFLKSSAHVSDAAWDSLMYQFNPVNFDPVAWAKMDKAMGVKYLTITTKHHEGFCLWPSKFTDFNISHTPYKKDILRQIVNAYNAEGIEVHFYYSILDWHNPNWRYDIKTPQDSIAFRRYLTFAYNQLKELATDYPSVNCFWFDGTWDNSVKQNGWWTLEVEKMLKAVHPGMIVNSRLRADDFGSRHFDSNGDLMGDYASGYERRLPSPYDTSVTKTDWEACMTIPENQWGYHKDWNLSYVKTTDELLEMLVRTTALGGNFLLNFGPKSDGTIRAEERAIADSIGQWMNLYGDAIYDCGYASGWQRQDWGYYTRPLADSAIVGSTSGAVTGGVPRSGATALVNAIVFNVPVSGILKVITPAKVRIKAVHFMAKSGGSNGPAAGAAVQFREISKDQYNIYLPPATHFDQPFVIKIEVESSAKRGTYQEAKT